jgi:hypothetical protein
MRMQTDGELHGRHWSEDVNFILKLNGLAVGVEKNIFKIGFIVAVSNIKRIPHRRQKEILLRFIEVIVSFQRLKAVDEFFVGVVSVL